MSNAAAIAASAVPTAEEYEFALANNPSFVRRMTIRIGRLADPLYKAEAYIGAKASELGKRLVIQIDSILDGLHFLIYSNDEEE
jgi:hypothetical protein